MKENSIENNPENLTESAFLLFQLSLHSREALSMQNPDLAETLDEDFTKFQITLISIDKLNLRWSQKIKNLQDEMKGNNWFSYLCNSGNIDFNKQKIS